MPVFSIFILVVVLTGSLAWFVAYLARRWRIVDRPDQDRKRHDRATPLLGGLAVFAAFFIGLFLVRDLLLAGDLNERHWIGFFAGACILMLGGFLDDKHNLSPRTQMIFPVLAILAVLGGGVEIEKISNPWGGYIYLDAVRLELLPGLAISLFSGLLIFFWLLGMMFTTKLLDGVDGLVAGVAAIGALVTALFTLSSRYHQPDISTAAWILLAACLGFLVLNWHPARVFLGEGGALFLGFALGVLSIISGGKIAVALLVMGVPIMDVAWTIIQRLRAGQNPFTFADRRHLHFRLQDLGLSPRQTAGVYYLVSALFGSSALFLQSRGKILALSLLLLLMFILIYFIRSRERKNV